MTVPIGIRVSRTACGAVGSRSTEISKTCFSVTCPGQLLSSLTLTVDDRVCKCATLLQDSMVLAEFKTISYFIPASLQVTCINLIA